MADPAPTYRTCTNCAMTGVVFPQPQFAPAPSSNDEQCPLCLEQTLEDAPAPTTQETTS